MKAVVLTGIRQMKIVDMPDPIIENDTDVLLKIEMVGVCGSDVHYYETGNIGTQVVEYPFVVGHECAATVKAVGKNVTMVKEGNRVVVDPAIVCRSCDQCKAGRENTCRNIKFLGCPGQIGGCLCEYLIMPQDCCYPVSKDFSLANCAMCEPLAIGYYCVQQATLKENADIAILGSGPIGLSCLLNAQTKKINACYMTDKIDCRVETAQGAGAAWSGNPDKTDIVEAILAQQPAGMDAVFECAGQLETLDQALDLLKPGGKLIMVGIPRENRVTFIADKMRRKEITLVNIRRQNGCTQKLIDLIATDKINADFMFTHSFKLADTQKAFDMVEKYDDGVIKAMIEI